MIGNGICIVFVKMVDGVYYVIEYVCSGCRCVVRKICVVEKFLFCVIVWENLDWFVYDYMWEFVCYGDEMVGLNK